METVMVYMTAGSMDEARIIGNALVQSRLVACVNMIENMKSIYRWEGKLNEDNEVVVVAKTTAARIPELIEKVKSLHSYDCPCVLTLPVAGGNSAFLEWIAAETE